MKTISLLFSLLLSLSTVNLFAEERPSNDNFSEAELEQMLAPIALYPDSLLTHILIASTYPLELVQADRWVSENPDLEAAEALERVESKSWDPSVKALVPFPVVLDRLSHDLDWTRDLGDAFLQDEEQLLASVQSLRRKADKAGNLQTLENMEVVREQQNIVIQPVEREVIYVPYYDTRVVYGTWYWAHHPPVYWNLNRHRHYFHGSYYSRHHDYYHGFTWYPRITISSNFFFGLCNWRDRHVVVIDRHHRYLNRFHDRRSHRRHLINRGHAKRWRHNTNHRRGVAYRNNNLRKRFDHNRIKTTNRHHPRTVTNRRSNHRDVKQRLRSDEYRNNTRKTRTYSRKNESRRERSERWKRERKVERKHTAVKQQLPKTRNLRAERRSNKQVTHSQTRATTKTTVRHKQSNKQRPANKPRRQRAENNSRSNKQQTVRNSTRRNNAKSSRRNHRRHNDR